MIVCSLSVSAQDQVIRIYGDTLECYVEKEDGRFLYYKLSNSRKAETEMMSMKEVVDIIYDRKIVRKTESERKIEREKTRRLQASAIYGYSWTLRDDDIYGEGFEDVYGELRGGPFLDFRVNYFIEEEIGVGALYSTSRFENNERFGVEFEFPDGTVVSGPLDRDRTVNYYALNLALNYSSDETNFHFQLDLGLGWLTLEDRAVFINDYILKSSGIGGHISARLNIDLGEGFYLPANVALKGFNLRSFDLVTSDEMAPEVRFVLQRLYDTAPNGVRMNRVELGVGLGFSF